MKLLAVAAAAFCALGMSAPLVAAQPVLVAKTDVSPDTAQFIVLVTDLDEIKMQQENLRQFTLLPGQTELVVEETEIDESPLHYYLYQRTPQGMRNVADVYRAPGQTITIDLTTSPVTVSGSALMETINSAHAYLTDGMNALADARQARDEEAFNKAVASLRQAAATYITQHPDSPGAIELMNMLTPEQIEIAELITPAAKSDLNGAMYDYYLNRLQAELQRKIQAEKVAPGNPAPDFSLPAPDGSMVSLSSLKGKYVMLDFWGSWCGWCIKGIPQMKEQYERLKDKVYFVSIACNDSKDAWTSALEKYTMPWIQLWSDPSTPAPEQITTLYAVEGFPTKFIIDPKGIIIYKVVGEDPNFYNLFDGLLK